MEENKKMIADALVPLNEEQLQDIAFDRRVMAQQVEQCKEHYERLARTAQRLNDHDAMQLQALVPVHNIRNEATSISQYFGILDMLLKNMEANLKVIDCARKEYMVSARKEIRQQKALRKQVERSRRDAEAKKQKREAAQQAEQ